MTLTNIVDCGAIGDGNIANIATNTAAIQMAIDSGGAYVPYGSFPVANGQLKITVPNTRISGDSSMAANPGSGQTSAIIGHGPGSTLEIDAPGCSVDGVSFMASAPGEQTVADAFILVTTSPISISDLFMNSPNIGISLQLPANADGEFWIADVLMEGTFGVAGIVVNIGNAAVAIRHVVMGSSGVQPPYGICVTAAGEVVLSGGCDIIEMGNCLAIVPGMNGVKGQYVNAIFVSDCLFDSGNGQGCVYVCPEADAYVLMARFANVWTSTADNGAGVWPTNGFTFIGTKSKPILPTLLPIQDVSLVNCLGRSFVGHCGLYATRVQGMSVIGSTFGGNYMGIWIAAGCSNFVLTGNKCGNYVPPPVNSTFGGNVAFGIYIELNSEFIVTGNLCAGNTGGGIKNLAPVGAGVVGLNLP